MPTGTLATGSYVPDVGLPVELTFNQDQAFLMGLRIVAWWSPVFGWDGTFGYSFSDTRVTTGDFSYSGFGAQVSAMLW